MSYDLNKVSMRSVRLSNRSGVRSGAGAAATGTGLIAATVLGALTAGGLSAATVLAGGGKFIGLTALRSSSLNWQPLHLGKRIRRRPRQTALEILIRSSPGQKRK